MGAAIGSAARRAAQRRGRCCRQRPVRRRRHQRLRARARLRPHRHGLARPRRAARHAGQRQLRRPALGGVPVLMAKEGGEGVARAARACRGSCGAARACFAGSGRHFALPWYNGRLWKPQSSRRNRRRAPPHAQAHRRRHDGREAGRRDARLHALPLPVGAARARGLRRRPRHVHVPALGEGAARLLEALLPRPSLPHRVHRRAGLHEEPRPRAHPQPPRCREEPARALRNERRRLRSCVRGDPAQRRRARLRRGGRGAGHPLRGRHQRPVARGHAHGGGHPRGERCGVLPVRARREARLPAALRRRGHLRRVRCPPGQGPAAPLPPRDRLRGQRPGRFRRGREPLRRRDREARRRGLGHVRGDARRELRRGHARRGPPHCSSRNGSRARARRPARRGRRSRPCA